MENENLKQERQCAIHDVMLSLPEVGIFGGWIVDNWKRTSYTDQQADYNASNLQ